MDRTGQVVEEVMHARNRWLKEQTTTPTEVKLPTLHTGVLLADALARAADEDERKRIRDLGLSAVYGGTLYGMTIVRTDGDHVEVSGPERPLRVALGTPE